MNHQFQLLPMPQQLALQGEGVRLEGAQLIRLNAGTPGELRFAARKLQHALKNTLGQEWGATASFAVPEVEIGIELSVDPGAVKRSQGYELSVDRRGVRVRGHDPAGVYYGVCTLIQMIEQGEGNLPGMRIQDWPDFPARGVLLDISRDKVYTMETLYSLVDMLAGWKINQLQLYMEHTFAYRNHPEVWAQASPMTGQEIMDLDAYCRERFIELVPNQNSFGHMHRWLTKPRYASLAEIHGEFQAPWGAMQGPFSLSPVDPGSLELMRELYDELLPHFSSRTFNVGCDEAVDLGQGRSKEACAERGIGRVYLDYLQKIYREVSRRGYKMQYWGDIIIHYPELIPELPLDATALEWGYEAEHPFGPHAQAFAAAGVPFYLCPGTSSWNTIAGRTSNAIGNLKSAAENGLAYGAMGYLNTDWGDNGHWQTLPVSFLGFAMGAAYSWAYHANRDVDVTQAVSLHAFQDASGRMGQVAYDLGEVYQALKVESPNSSELFWILQIPTVEHCQRLFARPEGLQRAMLAIEAAMAPLEQNKMKRTDTELIGQEYRLTVHMLQHAVRRGLWSMEGQGKASTLKGDLEEIIQEYRAAWLARNRPGGLVDSVQRLEKAIQDYR
jgi:hexosaminidase